MIWEVLAFLFERSLQAFLCACIHVSLWGSLTMAFTSKLYKWLTISSCYGSSSRLEPFADKQTCNYDTECSIHYPSLSTLRSKGLSRSKMKWWATYKNWPVHVIVRLPHPWSGDSQRQKTFLALSADKQTHNSDTACLNHHPYLSTLRSKGLSLRKMKWWTIYTSLYIFYNLSIYLSIYQSIYLSIYLSIQLYLSISISIYLYLYISVYLYICIIYICIYIYVIQGKNKQHINKNISTTAFINSCQHLQFIYSA